MYTTINFKTKKQLKEALSNGQQLTCFAPGLGSATFNGPISLEGPHFPKPHTWYAEGEMKNGILVKVK